MQRLHTDFRGARQHPRLGVSSGRGLRIGSLIDPNDSVWAVLVKYERGVAVFARRFKRAAETTGRTFVGIAFEVGKVELQPAIDGRLKNDPRGGSPASASARISDAKISLSK